MMAISLFELIPQAVALGSMISAVVGVILGAAMMLLLDTIVPHSHMSGKEDIAVENPEKFTELDNSMKRMGYLILFGIALHNIPEGLAIGAGLEASEN